MNHLKKPLEKSLIKHADTIQYLRIGWKPNTRFLSYLVNLVSLEINSPRYSLNELNHLENISLPNLKFLTTRQVPSKVLANLIENTKGHLSEISIIYYGISNERLERPIQAIYQNCPNLRYLRLLLIINVNSLILTEFENLLINCQYLNGLVIDIYNDYGWDKLFEILTKSLPAGLFKFNFSFYFLYLFIRIFKIIF